MRYVYISNRRVLLRMLPDKAFKFFYKLFFFKVCSVNTAMKRFSFIEMFERMVCEWYDHFINDVILYAINVLIHTIDFK